MIKSLAFLALLPAAAQAAALFAPGNTIFGVRSDGTNILVATAGTTNVNGDYSDNLYPANESPDHAIDGVGQKYLNFAELNTGVSVGLPGSPSIATSITLWAANDATERDPASYEVYGTNVPITGAQPLTDFTLISSGAIALPLTRNAGGAAVLDVATSATVNFANTTAYQNYLILFPTLRDEPPANSMQIAEVQLDGTIIPEPGSALLAAAGLLSLVRRRR